MLTTEQSKLIRDGQVAVLYSPEHGAGWSTWNQEYPELLFDPSIVEWLEQGELEKILTYVTLKYPDVYVGGIKYLTIGWVPVGTKFRIAEYDGAEYIETVDSVNWITA